MIKLIIVSAIAVLVVGVIVAIAVLMFLQRRCEKLLDTDVPPVDDRAIHTIETQRPTFEMTVTQHFPASPAAVWSTLEDRAFSWLPMIDGVHYSGRDRGPGTVRTLDVMLFAAAEQVTRRVPDTHLSVAGIKTSLPILVNSYTQDFRLRATPDGGTDLDWTVAGRPAIFAFLPLSWTAVFIRPFARIVIGQLATHYRQAQ